jgi:glycosyltransferase involved in cell wall biosynthesis
MVEVLPIGLDLERWPKGVGTGVAAPVLTERQADERIVGIFGRLETRKGHEFLLTAWPAIREEIPNARLWIVGAGHAAERLTELAKPYGDSVRFCGHVKDIRPIMRSVDIVVQPSLYEPFGITLLEAMACAKPIVCTSVGGMPEVVDESCAVIVPPGDPDQLGMAVAGLLIDGERAHEMGRSGRRRVEEHFALNVMIDRLESLLTADERGSVPSGRH